MGAAVIKPKKSHTMTDLPSDAPQHNVSSAATRQRPINVGENGSLAGLTAILQSALQTKPFNPSTHPTVQPLTSINMKERMQQNELELDELAALAARDKSASEAKTSRAGTTVQQKEQENDKGK